MGGLRDVMKRGNGTPRPRHMSEKTKEHLIEHDLGRPEGRTASDGTPEGAPKGKATPENRAASRTTTASRARTRVAASETVPKPRPRPTVATAGRTDDREAQRAAQRKYGLHDTLSLSPADTVETHAVPARGRQMGANRITTAEGRVIPATRVAGRTAPATLAQTVETYGVPSRPRTIAGQRVASRQIAATKVPAALAERVAPDEAPARTARERKADVVANRKERRKRRRVVTPLYTRRGTVLPWD